MLDGRGREREVVNECGIGGEVGLSEMPHKLGIEARGGSGMWMWSEQMQGEIEWSGQKGDNSFWGVLEFRVFGGWGVFGSILSS